MSASAGTVIKGEPQTSASLNSSNVRINLDGIFEGDLEPLRVTAQSSPNMTVAVASDNDRAYIQGNSPIDYAGGNSGTFTAPAGGGEKQIDLLTLDNTGALGITSGTPTTGSPSPPTYPSSKMVLAEIYLRNGMATIKNTDDSTNGYIFKARTPLFSNPSGIVQIVTATYGSDDTTTSATYGDTGLTANITPLFSDSKIIIMASAYVISERVSGDITDRTGRFRIRNTVASTTIAETILGRSIASSTSPKASDNNLALTGNDEPGTTDLQTYTVQFRTGDSTQVRTTLAGTTHAELIIMEVH